MSVSICVYVCARARVRDRRGGRERLNIFPVTYEPVGELLASRSVRVCIINVAVYFWLVLRVNVTGCAGLAASCEWLRAVNVSLGLRGTE